jgi:hypothetical protein
MPPADQLQRRARAALARRLAELAGADALHPGGEHALRFADALVPTLTPADVAWAHAQLAARAKGELRPARSGAVQAHAAWSSTALVCSAFAHWRARPSALRVAGMGGFDALRLEERLVIPHGGGTPNLDVALAGGGRFVGIESKLTEHLAPVRARPWPPAYRRPAMLAALDDAWAGVFADLLEGRWAPRFLDAGQLVRHALSLRAPPPARTSRSSSSSGSPPTATTTPRSAPTATSSPTCSPASATPHARASSHGRTRSC